MEEGLKGIAYRKRKVV